MNEQITIKELFSLDKTIAAGIFEGAVYPWEVLSKIGDYIVGLGNSLPQKEYYKRGDNIWIHKEATVFDSAYIAGQRCRSKALCIYKRKGCCRRKCSRW